MRCVRTRGRIACQIRNVATITGIINARKISTDEKLVPAAITCNEGTSCIRTPISESTKTGKHIFLRRSSKTLPMAPPNTAIANAIVAQIGRCSINARWDDGIEATNSVSNWPMKFITPNKFHTSATIPITQKPHPVFAADWFIRSNPTDNRDTVPAIPSSEFYR